MYGAAGWPYTPGTPGVRPAPKTKGIAVKGVAGQRPTRNHDSKYRRKEAKNGSTKQQV